MLAVLAVGGAGIAVLISSDGRAPADERTTAGQGYCGLVKTYTEALAGIQPTSGTPNVGSQLARAAGLVEEAKNNAPSVIRDDMEVFARAYEQVASALARAGYRPEAVGIETLQPLETPAFESALRRIADYELRACGIA